MSGCAFFQDQFGPCPHPVQEGSFCFWHTDGYKDDVHVADIQKAAQIYPAGFRLKGLDFSYEKVLGLKLPLARFKQVNWHACEFTECDFTGSHFIDCSMTSAVVKNSTFRQSHFLRCSLLRSRFMECDFYQVLTESGQWETCRFEKSILAAAQMQGMHLLQIDFSSSAFLTEESVEKRQYPKWRQTHILQCVLAGLELNFMTLHSCNVQKSSFLDCCFRRAWFHRTSFVDCEFDGSADLSQENFDGCELNARTFENLRVLVPELTSCQKVE